jgi:predicted dehydrogenase
MVGVEGDGGRKDSVAFLEDKAGRMGERLRIAIIGCGAITKLHHLPAVLSHTGIELVALVDADIRRAAALAHIHHAQCLTVADYRAVLSQVDAIIIALPNQLHASVILDALERGVDVLCEKPLATSSVDARACCELAVKKGRVLAVGMNRRFQPSSMILRSVLEEGILGNLHGYDCQYGAPYDWETASGFYFSKAQAGGGVLIDYGVHVLDSLVDWFGPVVRFRYQDDDWGSGIEANVLLDLDHHGRYGEIKGRVRLSRTYELANHLVVRGSACRAELPVSDTSVVLLHRRLAEREVSMTLRLPASNPGLPSDSFYHQLENFLRSIQGAELPVVDGWQALSTLELIEQCYAQRQRIPEPWSDPTEASVEVGA